MTVSEIIPYLTGPVAALLVLCCWVWTQRQDIADLREALKEERKRADSAEEAARTMNELLAKVLESPKARR